MDDIDCATESTEVFTASALKAVLARRDNTPSSGTCAACQSPIENERIAANPHARLCCYCAAEEEEARRRASRCGPR